MRGAFGSEFRGERTNLVVPAAASSLPVLNPSIQEEIAAEFQPKLLMYRLRNYRDILNTWRAPAPRVAPGLADCLAACAPGDPEVQTQIHSILRGRTVPPAAVKRSLQERLVDALLSFCHEQPRPATLSVARIAAAVNAELKRCSDGRSLSRRKIHENLKKLDLSIESPNGNIKPIYLDRAIREKVHDLAEKQDGFELNLGCRECAEIQRHQEESAPNLGSLGFGGIETEEDRALILRMRKDGGKEDDLSPNGESPSYAPPRAPDRF